MSKQLYNISSIFYNISNNQWTLYTSRNSFPFSEVNEEYSSEDLAHHCYCALRGHLQSYFWVALGHNEISDSFCHDSLPFLLFFQKRQHLRTPRSLYWPWWRPYVKLYKSFPAFSIWFLGISPRKQCNSFELACRTVLWFVWDVAGCAVSLFPWKVAYFNLLEPQENVKQKVYSDIHFMVFLVFSLVSQIKG